MRMLRWICSKTRKDRIRNANIRDMVGIAPTKDKLRENILGWYRHVCHTPIVVLRRSNKIFGSDNTRERGRPKLTLDAVIKKNIIGLNLSEHLPLNRTQ